ncbi:TetR family transcriptional regulator [Rhodococcus sp. ZPP]|uniref:TetR family transcriptional regulator n=1 Tax=Rhodococcus sp. ZPP TaxID=2749906 RepID=UPI001FCA6F34|nr:TetR family transcriptional regulator [Rhodococcus sp. ZPP]
MTLTDGRRRTTPHSDQVALDLVLATVSVIAREGLRGLTTQAVARETGVSDEAVLRSAGSTEALLDAALRYALNKSASVRRHRRRLVPRPLRRTPHRPRRPGPRPPGLPARTDARVPAKPTPRPTRKLLYAKYIEATSRR